MQVLKHNPGFPTVTMSPVLGENVVQGDSCHRFTVKYLTSNLLLESLSLMKASMCGSPEYNCPNTSSTALEPNTMAIALDYEAVLLFIFTKV